jgi:hypothetical protein
MMFVCKKGANFVTNLVSWHQHCDHHHMTLYANPYELAWLQRPVEREVSQPHEGGWFCRKK